MDEITFEFNQEFLTKVDDFSQFMKSLSQQNGLAEMLQMMDSAISIIIFIFVAVMSIVLWNAGLMGSLRRYGEIGLRLAMGEHKGHVYRSMILESLILGFMGALLGSFLGIAFAYYLQVHGIDMSSLMRKSTMLMSQVMKAKVTTAAFFFGFIPGLFLKPSQPVQPVLSMDY